MSKQAVVVEQLFNRAFFPGRPQRSIAYWQGVKDMLRLRLEGVELRQSYSQGTAEADAWISGLTEGAAIWDAYRTAVKVPG